MFADYGARCAEPSCNRAPSLTAAMAEATKTDHPPLGVLYREQRPTLGDVMAETIRKAKAGN